MNDEKDLNLCNDRANEQEGLDFRKSAVLETMNVGEQLNVELWGKGELWKHWLG